MVSICSLLTFATLLLRAPGRPSRDDDPDSCDSNSMLQFSGARAKTRGPSELDDTTLTVVSAACGGRGYAQAAAEMKRSLERLSSSPVRLVIVYDTHENLEGFRQAETAEPGTKVSVELVSYSLANLSGVAGTEPSRFACCYSKLLLHQLVPDARGLVLWVDADTSIGADLAQLAPWFREQQRKEGGDTVQVAMAWESVPSYERNWYHCCASVEFYRPMGLNSGVILFDFELWRRTVRDEGFRSLLRRGTAGLGMVDQDLFNMYFERHRGQLAQLPFEYNWRGVAVSGRPDGPVKIEHYNGCGIDAALGRDPKCHGVPPE